MPASLSQSQHSSIQNISLSISSADNQGPKTHTSHPPYFSFISPSFSSRGKHVKLWCTDERRLPEIRWLFRGPEAWDDPKMSGTIAVFYSPMVLCALCCTVWGHNSFTIILYPSVPQMSLCFSHFHATEKETADFVPAVLNKFRLCVCFCMKTDRYKLINLESGCVRKDTETVCR